MSTNDSVNPQKEFVELLLFNTIGKKGIVMFINCAAKYYLRLSDLFSVVDIDRLT